MEDGGKKEKNAIYLLSFFAVLFLYHPSASRICIFAEDVSLLWCTFALFFALLSVPMQQINCYDENG